MPRIERPGGLRLAFPQTYEAVEAPGAATMRGRGGTRSGDRFRPRPIQVEADADPLIEALERHGLEVAAEAELRPSPAGRTRSATRGEPEDISLTVPVEPGEEAVVLTEQDGVWVWSFPEPGAAPVAGTRRTRGLGHLAPRERTFRVSLPESGPATSRTRGPIADAVVGRVRTFVLKFVARAATGGVIDYLERDVRTGPIRFGSSDPTAWQALNGGLELPAGRPARLLLMVHGTFSSTLGGYGALGSAPWGREFLDRAGRAYDAVLGFDHRSLSVDPRANAAELAEFLRALDPAHAPRIDVVSHSRGGLVYRSLAELVLPSLPDAARPRLERAVFVGVPHAGTTLADADNWRDFIDLYTNIAVGACRFIGRLPQAKAVTTVLSELIQGIGGLVKALAEQALESGDVPGLSAMRPDGDFLRELNRSQHGQPRADNTFYCAITSEFRASLGQPHAPPELPRRLLMGLVDRLADRVLDEANDLVVNTASMTAIDDGRAWIKDRLHFESTPHIYHTNYFARPEVVSALTRWLELDGGSRTSAPVTRLSARVETGFAVLPADASVAELAELVRTEQPAWIIIRRRHDGRTLSYAYRRDEVEHELTGWTDADSVLDALNMHEWGASSECSPADAVSAEPAAGLSGPPTTRRIVVLDGDVPVGVIAPDDPRQRSADVLVTEAMDTGSGAAPPPPAPASRAPQPAPATRSRGGTRGTRSRSRGLDSAEVAPPPPAPGAGGAVGGAERGAAAPVECHVQAEMEDTVAVGETTTVVVTVSREAIDQAMGGAIARAAVAIATDRPLSIMVRPRRNFEIVGDARIEIPAPDAGQPADLYFDVRATHEGPGEVWVIVRQGGPRELATLKLAVQVVAERPARRGAAHAEARTVEPAADDRPLCQLRIFERDNGPEISHEYELHIPGRVLEVFASRPMRVDRAKYVSDLYERIEERWLGSDEDVDDFTAELRALGGSLFDDLFPPELQRALWNNRDALTSIQVISTEPFVPWELVHLKEPGEPLPDESLFLAELGLVRWLHGSWFPDRIRVRRGRARYVVPDYPHPDDKLPEAREEMRFLERSLAATAVEPQPAAVRKLLRGPGSFDLVHFACHGVADPADIQQAALMLEGRVENGNAIPASIDVSTVRETSRLEDADGNRPMVVLNACQIGRMGFTLTRVGGFAEAFLRRGAGVFIGSLWSVGDRSARLFTETLYESLKAGMPLAEAAVKARHRAAAEGDASWLAYAVYGHPGLRLDIE